MASNKRDSQEIEAVAQQINTTNQNIVTRVSEMRKEGAGNSQSPRVMVAVKVTRTSAYSRHRVTSSGFQLQSRIG